MADGASIAQGAKGKSLAATDDCPYCTRQGLPILPLRLAYPGPDVPKDKILTDSKVGKYVNRILSDGYVYLYDKRATEGWRCFAVTKDGYLREYPVDKRPSGKVTFQCSRAADSLLATTVNIRKPHEAGEVWIAYSSVWWTKKVRSQYEKDPSKRMQPINVPQLLGGGLPDGAFKVDPKGQSLVAKVAEYAGQADKFAQSTVLGVDRGKQAADQGKSMDNIMPGKAVAIPLYDAVGMLQEVRRYANIAQGKLAGLDTQYKRQLWNDQAVQQLKKTFENAGKSAEWSSDYAPKINEGKISQFRKEYDKKRMPLIADRDNICSDYVRLIKGDLFKCVRDNDFDHDDGMSCRHFTQQMAEVLNGNGLNLNERKYALSVLEHVNDENLWLRVLTANQKSLLGYLAKDQTSSLNDLGKNLYTAVDEWHKTYKKVAEELGLAEDQKVTSKLAEASKAGVEEQYFRWTLAGKEAVENAVHTAMLNLQTFVTDVKLAGLRQARIALFAGYLWLRVKFTPAVLDTTVAQELRRQKMQAWGTDLKGRIASHPIESGKSYSMNVGDVTDELGEAGHIPVRRIVIAWSLTLTIEPGASQSQIVEIMQQRNWVVRTGAISATTDPNLSSLPKATPALEQENGLVKVLKEGGANALFCGFILYFQAVSFGDSLLALRTAKGAGDTSYAVAKLASASIALLGAFVEASASLLLAFKGSLPKAVAKIELVEWSVANAGRFAAGGAIAGGVAGIIAGGLTICDGIKAYNEGETKTGALTVSGGIFFAVSGGFGILGGGAIFAEAGVLLGLGPGGWAVLAFGAIAIGVVLLFAGENARSNVYQNWLRKAYFGKDNANATVGYKDEKEEALAFGELFQLPLKVAFVWRKGFAGGNVDVDISVPALGNGSWINYGIAFSTSDGQILKGGENRTVGDGSIPSYSNMVTPAFKAYEESVGAFYKPRADGAEWHLEWAFGQASITNISVKLRYWPDKAHDPQIELPSAGGQTFNSTPQDGTKSS